MWVTGQKRIFRSEWKGSVMMPERNEADTYICAFTRPQQLKANKSNVLANFSIFSNHTSTFVLKGHFDILIMGIVGVISSSRIQLLPPLCKLYFLWQLIYNISVSTFVVFVLIENMLLVKSLKCVCIDHIHISINTIVRPTHLNSHLFVASCQTSIIFHSTTKAAAIKMRGDAG